MMDNSGQLLRNILSLQQQKNLLPRGFFVVKNSREFFIIRLFIKTARKVAFFENLVYCKVGLGYTYFPIFSLYVP